MKTLDLKNRLFDCGVSGAGGAGFPSFAKLSETGINTIILNCAECEPLLSVDKLLMADYTREIFDALRIISNCVGAEIIVAVKKAYKNAFLSCERIIDGYDGFSLFPLPDIYPTGDEVSLIYECTGRIVAEGSPPISAGVVVYNVETMLNAYYALNENSPVIYKYVTVAGEVNSPKTLKVPLGAAFSELIELSGGVKNSKAKVDIISGGPMTGKIASFSDFVTKTTKGVLVLPDNSFVSRSKKAQIKNELKHAMSVCSQCRMCTDLCPRFLLGHSIEPHKVMRAVTVGAGLSGGDADLTKFLGCLSCCECGVCEMFSCHQGLSPRKITAEYKNALRAAGIKQKARGTEYKANALFGYRRVSEHRLLVRLGLYGYETPSAVEDLTEGHRFKTLTVNLSQSIGASSVACVKKGEYVKRGEIIGRAAENALSLPLHSPVDGIVAEVSGTYIKLEAGGK